MAPDPTSELRRQQESNRSLERQLSGKLRDVQGELSCRGDIELPQEARLVVANTSLKADVLLLPHHSSKTLQQPGFWMRWHCASAIVQTGRRNRFG